MDSHHHKSGGGGGEAAPRRINVVYLLSRGGRTDHPHLFRVNHHSRTGGGVHLRDVKRWLSELRGKDMPGNYSWSYKRKYKGGYVWQDLKDDDLITPVSDNEYVLKGCDVRGTPPPSVQAPARTTTTPSLADEKEQHQKDKEEKKAARNDRQVEVVLLTPDFSGERSPKPPPAADQDSLYSPAGSSELPAIRTPFKIVLPRDLRHEQKQQQGEEEAVARAAAPEERLLEGEGAAGNARAVAGKQQAGRMGVARALHSIMTCGEADAVESALRPVERRSVAEAVPGGENWSPTPTCPGMDGCGLRVGRKAKLRKGGKDKPGKRDGDHGGKRDGPPANAANKPVPLPRCSQCGKEFKPKELHSHMQSCRGLKERMRSSTGSRTSVDRSRTSTARNKPDPSPVFLLTES